MLFAHCESVGEGIHAQTARASQRPKQEGYDAQEQGTKTIMAVHHIPRFPTWRLGGLVLCTMSPRPPCRGFGASGTSRTVRRRAGSPPTAPEILALRATRTASQRPAGTQNAVLSLLGSDPNNRRMSIRRLAGSQHSDKSLSTLVRGRSALPIQGSLSKRR